MLINQSKNVRECDKNDHKNNEKRKQKKRLSKKRQRQI